MTNPDPKRTPDGDEAERSWGAQNNDRFLAMDAKTYPTFEAFDEDWPEWRNELRRFAMGKLLRSRVPVSLLEPDELVQMTAEVMLSRWAQIRHPHRYMYAPARRFIQRATRRPEESEPTWLLVLPRCDVVCSAEQT